MSGRWTGWVVLVLAVVVLLLSSLGSAPKPTRGSVNSAAREGRQAAFLLLEELDQQPELWLRPPGELPAGPHQVWLADAPFSYDEDEDELAADDPLELSRGRGTAGALRYREFMERGGTLVWPATERVAEFLEVALELEPGPLVAWEREQPGRTFTEDLERVPSESELGTAVVAIRAEDERLALEVSVGAGSYILIAAGDYLDNDQIGEGDNGWLLAYLAARRAPGGRLLFDEHVLGLAGDPSSTSLAFSARGRLLTLHLALLLLVVCWRAAWVREFPRDPAALAVVSPLARAHSLAGLLRRAGRVQTLAEMLRAGDGRRRSEDATEATEAGRAGSAADGPRTLTGLAALDARLREREHAAQSDGNP